MIRHKETFYQDYSDEDINIPSHWVVQYYIDDSPYPEARYFNTAIEATEFEKEIEEQQGNK
jgi:hypothetical protein